MPILDYQTEVDTYTGNHTQLDLIPPRTKARLEQMLTVRPLPEGADVRTHLLELLRTLTEMQEIPSMPFLLFSDFMQFLRGDAFNHRYHAQICWKFRQTHQEYRYAALPWGEKRSQPLIHIEDALDILSQRTHDQLPRSLTMKPRDRFAAIAPEGFVRLREVLDKSGYKAAPSVFKRCHRQYRYWSSQFSQHGVWIHKDDADKILQVKGETPLYYSGPEFEDPDMKKAVQQQLEIYERYRDLYVDFADLCRKLQIINYKQARITLTRRSEMTLVTHKKEGRYPEAWAYPYLPECWAYVPEPISEYIASLDAFGKLPASYKRTPLLLKSSALILLRAKAQLPRPGKPEVDVELRERLFRELEEMGLPTPDHARPEVFPGARRPARPDVPRY